MRPLPVPWRRLGLPAGAAAAGALLALVASALLVAWWVPQWQVETAQALQAAHGLQQQQRRQAAAAPAGAPPWLAWRGTLPSAATRQEHLADLLALALRHGVTVARSEQRIEPLADLGLERYRVLMPASASYADLRAFVEAALLAQPALSLDRLRLQRSAGSTTLVEADLQWSLHLHADGVEP
jgi:hypothetical protein